MHNMCKRCQFCAIFVSTQQLIFCIAISYVCNQLLVLVLMFHLSSLVQVISYIHTIYLGSLHLLQPISPGVGIVVCVLILYKYLATQCSHSDCHFWIIDMYLYKIMQCQNVYHNYITKFLQLMATSCVSELSRRVNWAMISSTCIQPSNLLHWLERCVQIVLRHFCCFQWHAGDQK